MVVKQKISMQFSVNSEVKLELEYLKNQMVMKKEIEYLRSKLSRTEQALDAERAKKDTEHFQVINLRAQIQNMKLNYQRICQGLGINDQHLMQNPETGKDIVQHVQKNSQQSKEIARKQLTAFQKNNWALQDRGLRVDRGMNTRIMGIHSNLGALEELAQKDFEVEEQDLFIVNQYRDTCDEEVQTDPVDFS